MNKGGHVAASLTECVGTSLDDLHNAVCAGVDQHGAAVHARVAVARNFLRVVSPMVILLQPTSAVLRRVSGEHTTERLATATPPMQEAPGPAVVTVHARASTPWRRHARNAGKCFEPFRIH